VTRILPPAGMELLSQLSKRGVQVDIWQGDLPPPHDVLLQKAKGCVGICSLLTDKIDENFLQAVGPQLKVVSNFAVGYNNIDCKAAKARNIRVGHTPGVLDDATADMAFALLMATTRRIPESVQFAQQGKWKTWEPMGFVGCDLKGKTVGVVGLGRIGHAFAERCHRGWEMKVLYADPYRNEASEKSIGAVKVDFDTLLKESDFISVHCNLTPETTKLFGAKEFAKMKKTAVFINTSRGPVVDQKALYEACKNKTIFAAGIDVTDPEPPAADDLIFTLPNLVVAPHIASATIDTRNAMATICVNNLIAGLADKPLQHEVPETRVKSKL
jgi:glyoxylate reductase